MGCPNEAYNEMLIEYIRLNSFGTKYRQLFKDGSIDDLSTNELERIAKSFNQNNPFYRAFMGGIALINSLDSMGNDETNAAICMIKPFQEFLGVKEPEVKEVTELDENEKEIVETWTKEKLYTLENMVSQALLLTRNHTSDKEDKNLCEKSIIADLERVEKSVASLKKINNIED